MKIEQPVQNLLPLNSLIFHSSPVSASSLLNVGNAAVDPKGRLSSGLLHYSQDLHPPGDHSSLQASRTRAKSILTALRMQGWLR
ncbi:hypothetical protein AV530_016357 [Patagioenas fasciata monilis]|uniref:Uncharacterized protein n=1 Tax=Patagioenas fasciata monilis TaxID=372326 RepID=A0A1V4KPY6_PATFA|nr:hypothetical protein AV530_016357 [Patagioenas fasciata monilis]